MRMMNGFSEKIEDLFEYKIGEFFSTIGAFGLLATPPSFILISLIFSVKMALGIILGFFMVWLASVFLTLTLTIIFYWFYIMFFARGIEN